MTRSLDARGRGWAAVLWPFRRMAACARLAWRAFHRFNDHKGPDLAAAVSYYTLLTLVPLLVFTISLGVRVLGSFDATYRGATLIFQGILEQLSPTAQESLRAFVEHALRFQLLGIVLLAWTSKRAFGALASALETVFAAKARGFAHGNLLALAMVFSSGLALLAMIALTAVLATVEGLVQRHAPGSADLFQGVTAVLLSWVLRPLITFSFFFYLYRVVPRRAITTVDALAGAALGTGLWELARLGFTYYARHIARYAGLYGALEAIIVLALWLELSASIILYCGEVVALLIEGRRSPAAPAERAPAAG
jgi:membrane protein